MGFKLGAIVGFTAGYVKGAKAGRERYEEIKGKMSKASNSPALKKVTESVKPLQKGQPEAKPKAPAASTPPVHWESQGKAAAPSNEGDK